MYYIYILLSLKDKRLYIGYTSNLQTRLIQHEQGFSGATKYRRPLKLIHYEAFLAQEDALRREEYLKGGNGHKEMKILLKNTFKQVRYKYY